MTFLLVGTKSDKIFENFAIFDEAKEEENLFGPDTTKSEEEKFD